MVPQVSRAFIDAFWAAVAIAGFLVMFDSVLFVVAAMALLVGGGGIGNPYTGIFVFLLAPLGVVAGGALCWLAYEMLRARQEGGPVATGEIARLHVG